VFFFQQQLYIWQLNIFRAKFDSEEYNEIVKTQKLYWKIEYGNESERGKEYTPAAKRKPSWNYWTQIRDDVNSHKFYFSLLSKTEGREELGSLELDLVEFRKRPDEQNRMWEPIFDKDKNKVGELHLSITYKPFEVDVSENGGNCSKLNVYCMNSDDSACSIS